MNLRQTLILAAVLLPGVVTISSFIARPAAAEPKSEPAAGRYQIAPIANGNAAGSMVVMDTATGECWSNDTSGQQGTWHPMGVPSKAK